MRYIYFNYGTLTVSVHENADGPPAELIGTSTVWERAKPTTKKFIVASLIATTQYKGLKGLTIVDCDVPKPAPSIEQETPDQ